MVPPNGLDILFLFPTKKTKDKMFLTEMNHDRNDSKTHESNNGEGNDDPLPYGNLSDTIALENAASTDEILAFQRR
jgi:predicted neuraminidase